MQRTQYTRSKAVLRERAYFQKQITVLEADDGMAQTKSRTGHDTTLLPGRLAWRVHNKTICLITACIKSGLAKRLQVANKNARCWRLHPGVSEASACRGLVPGAR